MIRRSDRYPRTSVARPLRAGERRAIIPGMAPKIGILYADDDVLVVDKDPGIVCVPERYEPESATLIGLLSAAWGKLYPVHRIDRDTSGVVVIARTAEAHRELNACFFGREVKKEYRAIVRGTPEWKETACDMPLRADGDRDHRSVVDTRHGRESRTAFALISRLGPYSLVVAFPETGRTHQIRVHLSALGYPIACDPLYGDGEPICLSRLKRKWRGDPWEEKPLISRTALHAYKVSFPHPRSGELASFEAPYRRDFIATIKQLEKTFPERG
jgi:RluA family pseudouridine synthase